MTRIKTGPSWRAGLAAELCMKRSLWLSKQLLLNWCVEAQKRLQKKFFKKFTVNIKKKKVFKNCVNRFLFEMVKMESFLMCCHSFVNISRPNTFHERPLKSVCVFALVLQGVLESFVGTALTGAVFCMLAGQPLTILSSTGPVLVFERLLFNFSKWVVADQHYVVVLVMVEYSLKTVNRSM